MTPSEQTFSRDLYVHTTPSSVGLGPVELGKCGTIPANRIEGISGGEVGVRPLSLSVSPVWPHGGISQFRCCSLCERDRFEGRMQDGTVTTESSHGRMGSVGRTMAGCHSGLGSGVHALQSSSIYNYSRVLGYGHVP
jgi:hypothetical protein